MYRRLALAALLALANLAAATASAEEWHHVIAPYTWAPGLEGSVSTGDKDAEVDASASDLLEDLELAGLVRYEGSSSKWGVLVDGVYMGLGHGLDKDSTEVDFDMTILEVAGSYHATPKVEVLFGARGVDLTTSIDSPMLPNDNDSDTWVDAIVGARLKLPISRKWRFALRGDVGAGGSDDSWNVETGFSYDASERTSLAMGWRVLAMDRETGDAGFDGTLSGPELGFAFRF